MKKSTKVLLVLAAIVAMTIGAVSTVMAADDYPVIDKWGAAADSNGRWTAKNAAGADLKSTWAVSQDGHWYYFESDGKTVVNDFIKWRGNYYYFGKDGIMATGWVKFDYANRTPITSLGITAVEGNNVLDNSTGSAYGKTVWCYFDANGVATADKWVEVDGLWYYMRGIVMLCNDYCVNIGGKKYGFSGNGNMHVGWIPVVKTTTENASGAGPTATSATTKDTTIGWVYYATNGEMAADGWKNIDGTWYYFVTNIAGTRFTTEGVPVGATVMLSNTFGVIDPTHNEDCVFYMGSDGSLQRGIVSIAAKTKLYTSVANFLSDTKTNELKAATYSFDSSTGVQKVGGDPTKVNDYYFKSGEGIYKVDGTYTKNSNIISTAALADINAGESISGMKVTNAFKVVDSDVYYYDVNGYLVKDRLVDFYGLTIGFDSNGKMIKTSSTNTTKVGGANYYFAEEFGKITVAGVIGYGCGTKAPEQYTVTAGTHALTDCKVALSPAKTIIGSTVTVTVTPDSGKTIAALSAENIVVSGATVTVSTPSANEAGVWTATFVMPASNVTVTVTATAE